MINNLHLMQIKNCLQIEKINKTNYCSSNHSNNSNCSYNNSNHQTLNRVVQEIILSRDLLNLNKISLMIFQKFLIKLKFF